MDGRHTHEPERLECSDYEKKIKNHESRGTLTNVAKALTEIRYYDDDDDDYIFFDWL